MFRCGYKRALLPNSAVDKKRYNVQVKPLIQAPVLCNIHITSVKTSPNWGINVDRLGGPNGLNALTE